MYDVRLGLHCTVGRVTPFVHRVFVRVRYSLGAHGYTMYLYRTSLRVEGIYFHGFHVRRFVCIYSILFLVQV